VPGGIRIDAVVKQRLTECERRMCGANDAELNALAGHRPGIVRCAAGR